MADRTRKCAPPPELLGESGWYWVTGPHTTGPLYWVGARGAYTGQWQRDGDDQSPEEAYRIGCRYIGPVTPHAEVEALRAAAGLACERSDGIIAAAIRARTG